MANGDITSGSVASVMNAVFEIKRETEGGPALVSNMVALRAIHIWLPKDSAELILTLPCISILNPIRIAFDIRAS